MFLLLSLLSVVSSLPGGYTGLGGMYKNMDQHKDYMPMAHFAAQMAQSLERDDSLAPSSPLAPGSSYRSPRRRVYVPTFFSNYPMKSYSENYPGKSYTSRYTPANQI